MKNTVLNHLFHAQFIVTTPRRCRKAVSDSLGLSDASTIRSNLSLNCHDGEPEYEASVRNGFSNKLQCVSLVMKVETSQFKTLLLVLIKLIADLQSDWFPHRRVVVSLGRHLRFEALLPSFHPLYL